MLERVEHDNGVVFYQSPLLTGAGAVHGFSTRLGGVSKPPFESLNLDVRGKHRPIKVHDRNTSISANFRKLRAAIGAERLMRVESHQVHGANVWWAPPKPLKFDDSPKADALVSDQRDKLLCIRVADCVPVLISSAGGGAGGKQVAAVHAGWRGLGRGVIAAAVGEFDEPGDLVAAVGPCIGVEAFEVDHEVARWFQTPGVVRRDLGPRPHIDLRLEAQAQLHEAGVSRIDVSDRCTYRDESEFFSHRRDMTHRDQPATGRMVAVIGASKPQTTSATS